MKDGYIHITMVIDESGSMYSSKEDVKGGIKNLVEEQKKNKDGKVTLSLYTFNDKVDEVFVGKDINDFDDFEYDPTSMTAMNDGIGTAIDKTGKWLANMKEEDRPSKVLVAIFTDGLENSSKEYTLSQVKEMIAHQEKVYSWTFMYLGTDITTTKMAEDLGIRTRTYSSRRSLSKNYDIINCATSAYRNAVSAGATLDSANDVFCATLTEASLLNTNDYEKEIGKKIENE